MNKTALRARALDFEDEKHITLASKKLLILIPDSCFCLPSFKDVAPYEIEDVEVPIKRANAATLITT